MLLSALPARAHHRFISNRLLQRAAVVLAVVSLSGCGNPGLELVPVEGQVTLDGEPLPGAQLIFKPENGRPSIGKTDADGRYELRYTAERRGAMPGKHKVSITTAVEADPDASDPQTQTGSRERVPARYNSRTSLLVDVNADLKEPVDFRLESAASARPARP